MSGENLERLRDGARRKPNDVEAWYQLGAAAAAEGELEEAREALERVVAQAPEHLSGSYALSRVLSELGDVAGAIECARRVVALTGGRDLGALTLLGIALSTDGQHDEAVRILSDVATRRSKESSAHADLGMALLAAKRWDVALVAFSRARDLDPTSAQAQCGLGLVHQAQGRWWEAAEAFRKTEQLAPDNPVGPMNLGVALQTIGEHEQARQALLRAAALAPDDQEIRQALDNLAVPEPVQDEVTRPALQPDTFQASISGDLKTFQLVDVLEFLRHQNRTGALVISSPVGAGTVRMAGGRVTSASAPGVQRLGETLVQEGMLSAQTLEAALAHQENDREEALGSVLLRDGALTSNQLARAVLQQIMTAIEGMLDWTEGAFSFHGSEPSEAPPISFSFEEVMLRVTQARDERKHGMRR